MKTTLRWTSTVALLSGLTACGARPPVEPPAAVATLTPDAPPAPPFEPPHAGAESMNTEYFLGSAAQESARFREFAEQIRLIQARQTASRDQPVQRGFHAKSHGCAYGRLELDPDRDPRTRYGVFAEGAGPWPVWARFSNGVGWQQADDALDARGFAVKLMGVPGPKLLPDEKGTQDFQLTNSPTPVGANAEEFMRFAHANAKGTVPGLGFAVGHLGTAAPALLRTNPIPSMVTAQYWSGGAFHLGAHQAAKFVAKPCAGVAERTPDDTDPDYLRADLAAAAAEPAGLCFEFFVQLQVDPERTPIENAAVEWAEDVSPPLRVGRFVFPKQDLSDPRRAPFCRQLSFNPWHGVAAHQPMGHINRARRFVYDASRDRRQGGAEPVDFAGFDVPVVPEPAAPPASTPPGP
jgi:catalase/predicted small lipoprotein YifL